MPTRASWSAFGDHGDDNAFDPNGPAGMAFTFETTPAGSRNDRRHAVSKP